MAVSIRRRKVASQGAVRYEARRAGSGRVCEAERFRHRLSPCEQGWVRPRVRACRHSYRNLSGDIRYLPDTVSAMGESVFSEGLGYEREVVFVVEVAGVLA